MQTFNSPLWSFIFGMLIGGAFAALIIYIIAAIKIEKYLDRHSRIERWEK